MNTSDYNLFILITFKRSLPALFNYDEDIFIKKKFVIGKDLFWIETKKQTKNTLINRMTIKKSILTLLFREKREIK